MNYVIFEIILVHSSTFAVFDDTNNGCGCPFTIAKNAGMDVTPQYPGVYLFSVISHLYHFILGILAK